MPRSTEPLPALLAHYVSSGERFVQFRLWKYPVATDTAAQPCGERLLVREAAGVHRPEFWREELGVVTAHSKDDQRAGVTEHGRADGWRKLIEVLIGEDEMQREFPCLRKQRSERVGAEGLKFVNMYEEWNSRGGRLRCSLHRHKLHMRYEERAEEV